MLSNLLELAGLSALVAGVYELSGRGFALLALACCLLFVGYAAGDFKLGVAVRLKLAPARQRVEAFRRKRAQTKRAARAARG